MTEQNHIAILGAGIMGLSAAFALCHDGHDITLYDPAPLMPPTDNASALAGGMLAPFAEIEHMPHAWVEAGLAGIEFWKDFSESHDIDFHQNGSLLIAHPEDHHILERFQTYLQDYQCNQDIKTARLEPQIAARFPKGLHLPQEAHLHPVHAIIQLYKTIEKNPVTFIREAQTPNTLPKNYDYIIDCRGMGAENDEPELRGVKGEMMLVHNPEFILSRPVRLMHPRYPLYIVPRNNHVFMIGATNIESSENRNVSLRSGLELMSALYSLHPSFGEAEILEICARIRPAYPDNLPRIRQRDHVISCNGLYRHGFLLAPVMAKCIADQIAGRNNKLIPLLKGKPHEHYNKRKQKNLHRAA